MCQSTPSSSCWWCKSRLLAQRLLVDSHRFHATDNRYSIDVHSKKTSFSIENQWRTRFSYSGRTTKLLLWDHPSSKTTSKLRLLYPSRMTTPLSRPLFSRFYCDPLSLVSLYNHLVQCWYNHNILRTIEYNVMVLIWTNARWSRFYPMLQGEIWD